MSDNRVHLPKTPPTAEKDYHSRRKFIAKLALGASATAAAYVWLQRVQRISPEDIAVMSRPGLVRPEVLKHFPARRNAAYNLDTSLTKPVEAYSHNNFYEFSLNKSRVWFQAQDFVVDPWTIEVTGECHKPRKFDIDDIFKLLAGDMEERTYRFRCVEAWAMDVPWAGFELRRLLEAVEPKSKAKFVRFISAHRPEEMPGMRSTSFYPWPYFEGLRMDEAMNELALLATGIYGQPLPRSNGAPFRLVVPWKYGYKSAKSIVRIELLERQPATFWETLEPREYPFESNVNPAVPHPRWSQASETMIGTGERRPTQLFNGYGKYVAKLYSS